MSTINLHRNQRQSKDKKTTDSRNKRMLDSKGSSKCSYSTSIAQSSSNSLANISVSFMKDMNFPKLFDQTPMLFSFNPQTTKNSTSLSKSTSSSGLNSGVRTPSASSSYSSFKGFFSNAGKQQTKNKSLFGKKQKEATIDLSKKSQGDKNMRGSVLKQHKHRNSVMTNRLSQPKYTNLITNPTELVGQQESIKVFIRIKPREVDFDADKNLCPPCIKRIDEKHIQAENKVMAYDYVFPTNSSQQDIYTTVAQPVVESVLDGYNGTIFAYGQTGSGKTYTIFGNIQSIQEEGLIPRVIKELFARKQQDFTIDLSLLQIYKEDLVDLLTGSRQNLKIKQTSAGITVQNQTRVQVHSTEEGLQIIECAEKNRKTATTKLNQKSSRSHTILTLYLKNSDTQTKLCLIDLAGSQKINKSGVSGQNLQEAKKINSSLSCLGNVINALVTRKKTDHIPFRDSKLTRLLKDSLSGKFKTSIIVNCSSDPQQTVSSLKFANRAKKVKVTISKNNLKGKQNIQYLQLVIKKLTCDLQCTKKQLDKYKGICNQEKTREQSSNSMQTSDPHLESRESIQPLSEQTGLICNNQNIQNQLVPRQNHMKSVSQVDITPRQTIPSQRANAEQAMRKYGESLLSLKNSKLMKTRAPIAIQIPNRQTNRVQSNQITPGTCKQSRKYKQNRQLVNDNISQKQKTVAAKQLYLNINLNDLSSLNVSRSVGNFFGQINSPSVSSMSIHQDDNSQDLSLNFSLQKSESNREKNQKVL